MVSLEFCKIFCFLEPRTQSPFLNQDKMYSGSNDVNSSSSSVEFKDSDSLSNASDDELENLFEMILQVFV